MLGMRFVKRVHFLLCFCKMLVLLSDLLLLMSLPRKNGGYLRAIDPQTESQLWTVEVYHVDYDSDRDRDFQDVFITEIEEMNGQVKVVDEEDREFVVDPGTQSVRAL